MVTSSCYTGSPSPPAFLLITLCDSGRASVPTGCLLTVIGRIIVADTTHDIIRAIVMRLKIIIVFLNVIFIVVIIVLVMIVMSVPAHLCAKSFFGAIPMRRRQRA